MMMCGCTYNYDEQITALATSPRRWNEHNRIKLNLKLNEGSLYCPNLIVAVSVSRR